MHFNPPARNRGKLINIAIGVDGAPSVPPPPIANFPSLLVAHDETVLSKARNAGWTVAKRLFPLNQTHVRRYEFTPFELFEVGLKFDGAVVAHIPHRPIDSKRLLETIQTQPDEITRDTRAGVTYVPCAQKLHRRAAFALARGEGLPDSADWG
tara:strand:- start:1755 stop:2213 length:459 start_codon:yes stop_codon:yes gene_type:complete